MKLYNNFLFIFFAETILIIFSSCTENTSSVNKLSSNPYGIGDIKRLEVNPINDSLMQKGKTLFDIQCTSCHIMEHENDAPDISDILSVRKKEWIINFLLNKDAMLTHDSLALLTLKKYNQKCSANIKTFDDALLILEYLRMYQIWLHEINALK
ncbi:MAG: c-type cytochrome [Bacteroidia bacterium]|nr:c-type cytochrome [Bacteroidia bacterium]